MTVFFRFFFTFLCRIVRGWTYQLQKTPNFRHIHIIDSMGQALVAISIPKTIERDSKSNETKTHRHLISTHPRDPHAVVSLVCAQRRESIGRNERRRSQKCPSKSHLRTRRRTYGRRLRILGRRLRTHPSISPRDRHRTRARRRCQIPRTTFGEPMARP